MPAVLEAPVRKFDEVNESDGNAQEIMSKLFSLLAEAEAAVRTGDEWLTPEEVDATIEV
jgi:hypothetical protein